MTREEFNVVSKSRWVSLKLKDLPYTQRKLYKEERPYANNKGERFYIIRIEDLFIYQNSKVSVICPICGKERTYYYSYILTDKVLPVCNKCKKLETFIGHINRFGVKILAYKNVDKDTSLTKGNGTLVKCLCPICGKEFWNALNSVLYNVTKDCSCTSRKKSSLRMTEYNRKIGRQIYSELPLEEQIKYTTLRRKAGVFNVKIAKKRGYICAISGKYCKGNCEMHHLYSLNTHPNLALKEINLVLLKQDLHIAFHNQFGRGFNTLAQYKEFCSGKSPYNTKIN